MFLAACTPASEPEQAAAKRDRIVPVLAGRLENRDIDEASGLARSQRRSDVFWVINDSGKPRLHPISSRGKALGRVKLDDASNSDWEDLASFALDGEPYLLVADVGDNDGKRKDVRLYIVAEPAPDDKEAEVAWEFDFSYPGGPRDVEAIAVDAANDRVLLLSKREIPTVLYAVPLRPDSDKRQMAIRLGEIASLPRPRRQDIEFAPKTKDWWWQPTGMDLAEDGRAAVILTYRGVFYYRRNLDEDWQDALQRRPLALSLGDFGEAESVAFNAAGDSIYITFEGKGAPVVRIDIVGLAARTPATVTIMTFNAQNLFDNVDDPNKDDKAYLPIEAKQRSEHITACNRIGTQSWRDECLELDWNDAAIDHKLGVMADTIRQFAEGRGADIIVFQEVENRAVLERLRVEHLADAGYQPAILIEGNDDRGIDVAFLSKLPLAEQPILHDIAFDDFPDRAGDTRGVLQATFELPDGNKLTGFAVHFPAPYHPTEMRVAAYRHLAGLRGSVPDDQAVFAAGDFNTVSTEMYAQGMLDNHVRPVWTVAHDSCQGCPGTYYYAPDDNWSFLDMILFSPARGEKTTWQIRADSVQILNHLPAQVTSDGRPNSYKAGTRTGVSDHWPIAATIESIEKQ